MGRPGHRSDRWQLESYRIGAAVDCQTASTAHRLLEQGGNKDWVWEVYRYGRGTAEILQMPPGVEARSARPCHRAVSLSSSLSRCSALCLQLIAGSRLRGCRSPLIAWQHGSQPARRSIPGLLGLVIPRTAASGRCGLRRHVRMRAGRIRGHAARNL